MKVLCLIPALAEDLAKYDYASLKSVLAQTLQPDMIVLLPKKGDDPFLPARMSQILNNALQDIHLEHFDCILRVDADGFLPRNYVEQNLNTEADIVGDSANGMLLKVSAFKKGMNAKFHRENDDSYTFLKLQSLGFKHAKCRVNKKLLRKSKADYDWRTKLEMGKQLFQRGFEPLHFLFSVRFRFWYVLGYFLALIKRVKKWDVANYVFHYQTSGLLKRLRI